MQYLKTLVAAGVIALASAPVLATPSAEEIAHLGKDLTPIGAERAGNKDGTIPEWTGGLCKPPAGYKPINGKDGSPYVDPYASDKPLFTITAANVETYADKLDEGQQRLFKLYPQTYRIVVYPSHRSACQPDWVYQNTISRAASPKLVGDAPGLEDAHAQVPFPIPKSGQEAMYNTMALYWPVNFGGDWQTWLMDSAGNKTMITRQSIRFRNSYWDNSKTQSDELLALATLYHEPASTAGQMDMRIQWLRMDRTDPKAWFYTPGQRRVRLAPEFTYDTVAAQYSGLQNFDEIRGFDGKMDRFDFRIVGKKEMYIPYNVYKYLGTPPDDLLQKNHINPDALRYELHRVWVIEATLKPGARHVDSKKVFYIDEDSWDIVAYQAYDHAGKLIRSIYYPIWQAYDQPATLNPTHLIYDFVKNAWAMGSFPIGEGYHKLDPAPSNYFTADAMVARGVR